MRTNTLIRPMLLSLAAFAFSACNSSSAPPAPPAPVIVDGPLDYVAVARRLAEPVGPPRAAQATSRLLTTGGRSTAGSGAVSGDIAATTGVLAILCPEAAPVLGPISVISQWVNGNQVAAQISTINTQLAYQQQEINTLQQDVATGNQMYLDLVALTSKENACGALQNWVTLQQQIYTPTLRLPSSTGCGGTFSNASSTSSLGYNFFYESIGVGPATSTPSTVTLGQSAASSSGQMPILAALATSNALGSGGITTAAANLSMSEASSYSPTSGLSTNLADQIMNARGGIQSLGTKATSTFPGTTTLANTTAALLIGAYQNFLATALPVQGTAGTNLVTSIAAWNELVMSVYQQNLMALNWLYEVEAMTNYMNFYNWNQYVTGQICGMATVPSWATCPTPNSPPVLQQIQPWESAFPVSFSVTSATIGASGETTFAALGLTCPGGSCAQPLPAANSTATSNPFTLTQQYFLQAQQNLAILYAQRVNFLYQGVMNFIISDPLLSTQAYTAPPPSTTIPGATAPVTYPDQATLYTPIPAANLGAITGGTSVPSQVVPGWNVIGIATGQNPTVPATSSGGVLYQYPGVNQLYSCTGASGLTRNASAQEIVNLANCATPFPSTGGGYYDGVNMQAYAPNGSVPAGAVLTNSTNGWASTATGTLDSPSIFLWAWLIPTTWGGTNLVNDTMAGSTTGPPAFGVPCISSSDECLGYWFRLPTTGFYSFDVAPGSLSTNFLLIASSSSSSPYYGYGSGNFYASGSGSSWQLKDGGLYQPNLDESEWPDHIALLQVTLPNGYNLPFYMVTAELFLGPSSTPVCTGMMSVNAWPPGLTNCWQQNVGNGGIGVQTADGAIYYVNLTPSGSNAGSNAASLAVSSAPASTPLYSYNGIAAPSGTYYSSCNNISWNGYMLYASCRNDSGQYVSTTLVYDPWDFLPNCTYGSAVSNSNGKLTCY
jgi:hypothetical protein